MSRFWARAPGRSDRIKKNKLHLFPHDISSSIYLENYGTADDGNKRKVTISGKRQISTMTNSDT